MAFKWFSFPPTCLFCHFINPSVKLSSRQSPPFLLFGHLLPNSIHMISTSPVSPFFLMLWYFNSISLGRGFAYWFCDPTPPHVITLRSSRLFCRERNATRKLNHLQIPIRPTTTTSLDYSPSSSLLPIPSFRTSFTPSIAAYVLSVRQYVFGLRSNLAQYRPYQVSCLELRSDTTRNSATSSGD
jgi:hypothetical protein